MAVTPRIDFASAELGELVGDGAELPAEVGLLEPDWLVLVEVMLAQLILDGTVKLSLKVMSAH